MEMFYTHLTSALEYAIKNYDSFCNYLENQHKMVIINAVFPNSNLAFQYLNTLYYTEHKDEWRIKGGQP